MTPQEIVSLAQNYCRTSGHPYPETDDEWWPILNEALLYISDVGLLFPKTGVPLTVVSGQAVYRIDGVETPEHLLVVESVRVDGTHLTGPEGVRGPYTRDVAIEWTASEGRPTRWANWSENEIFLSPSPEGGENITLDGFAAHPKVESDFSAIVLPATYHRLLATITAALALDPFAHDKVVDKVARLSQTAVGQLAEAIERGGVIRKRLQVGQVRIGSYEPKIVCL